jgi:hypothetical protein
MGKPLAKASEGDGFDILREWEEVTQTELQQGSGWAFRRNLGMALFLS